MNERIVCDTKRVDGEKVSNNVSDTPMHENYLIILRKCLNCDGF